MLSEKKLKDKKMEDDQIELETLKQLTAPLVNDYEPKMFGLSTRGGGIQDAILLLCVFGGFGSLMVMGFMRLVREDTDEKKKKNKNKNN